MGKELLALKVVFLVSERWNELAVSIIPPGKGWDENLRCFNLRVSRRPCIYSSGFPSRCLCPVVFGNVTLFACGIQSCVCAPARLLVAHADWRRELFKGSCLARDLQTKCEG